MVCASLEIASQYDLGSVKETAKHSSHSHILFALLLRLDPDLLLGRVRHHVRGVHRVLGTLVNFLGFFHFNVEFTPLLGWVDFLSNEKHLLFNSVIRSQVELRLWHKHIATVTSQSELGFVALTIGLDYEHSH